MKFIADLKAAVGEAMAEVPFGFGIDAGKINAHTATPANAEMIAEYLYSYR